MPIIKKIRGKTYRFLSHEEKEKKDQELADEGLSGFTITRDGVTYEIINGKMVPVSGNAARKALGRGKKSRKVS